MAAISHLKNRVKKLSRESFDKGRRHSIVYMDDDGNIIWEEGVNYNTGLLAVPMPSETAEEWEQRIS